jgi:hypothetical protein
MQQQINIVYGLSIVDKSSVPGCHSEELKERRYEKEKKKN